jgi:hypothetical protein
MRRAALAAVLMLLGACQPAGPEPAAGAGPVMQEGDITVTPLDPPEAERPAAAAAAIAPPQAAAAVPPEAAADPTPPPAGPKSPQQLACERGGGRYVAAGSSGARACVRPTRDAGKRCDREGDCEGQCLARSQSCAPIRPLFGCNDVLQADGRRVTLCVD